MKGHPKKKIGDFCRTGSGGTPSRGDFQRYYEGGDIPWVKSGELREGLITSTEEHVTKAALSKTSIKLVPPGAILLAMYGATVGRLAILGVEAATNQAICHIVPNPDEADTRYLYYALSDQVPEIIAMGVGGAQPNISQGLIKELRIPLPPLAEQRRIAAILDQADALRAKRRESLAQLETLKQSIFLDMFGDPEINPKKYPTKRLKTLIRSGDSINYGVVQPGDDVINGVPLVRVGDISEGSVDHHSLKRISREIECAYSRSRLRGDEILVSCVGSVGLVALVTEAEEGFNIARSVARIRIANGYIREFFAWQLRCESIQNYFKRELRTVSQPTLNIQQLSETNVIVPDKSEQVEFATRLFHVEKAHKTLKNAAIHLESLFASLQHRAFRGEL